MYITFNITHYNKYVIVDLKKQSRYLSIDFLSKVCYKLTSERQSVAREGDVINMNKIISQKCFIQKLKFYLAFYFDDKEVNSISDDYHEWFAAEISHGKSEEQICLALGSPQKVVSDLLADSDKSPIRLQILLQNTVIQIFLSVIMYILINTLLLKAFDRSGVNYLYAGLGMPFIYFVAGMIIVPRSYLPESDISRKNFNRYNLFLPCLALVIILFEMLFFSEINAPKSGPLCFWAAAALTAGLLSANMLYVVRELFQDKLSAFLITCHSLGVSTLLLYLMNQLHLLYHDFSQHAYLIYGSICIYAETVILCFIMNRRRNR